MVRNAKPFGWRDVVLIARDDMFGPKLVAKPSPTSITTPSISPNTHPVPPTSVNS